MPITINGSGTITGLTAGGLPDASVVQADLAAGVAGTGPAFSAYATVGQSISNVTWTKITLDTEEWDTNNNFASSRFTPTVAGYYMFSATVMLGGISTTSTQNATLSLYKNGGASTRAGSTTKFSDSTTNPVTVSAMFYMNGSTDYVELYFLQYSNATQTLNAGSGNVFLQGFLARAA